MFVGPASRKLEAFKMNAASMADDVEATAIMKAVIASPRWRRAPGLLLSRYAEASGQAVQCHIAPLRAR